MLERHKGACGITRAAVAAASLCIGMGGGAALADEAVVQTMAPAGDEAPEEDSFWTRDTLTGDWGGLRTSLEESGVTVELGYTA